MAPITITPFEPPWQLTFVLLIKSIVKVSGWFMVTIATAEHPPGTVTVTVCCPAVKFVAVAVVCEFALNDHK